MKGKISSGCFAVLFFQACLFLAQPTFGQNAPIIVIPPQSQAIPQGGTAYLSVSVTGDLPINYKWRRNYESGYFYDVTLDSTNCTLVLSNLTPSMAATFSVRAENAYGISATKVAAVSIISAGMETNGFSLTIRGLTNSIWRIECCTNFQAQQWYTLTNLSIPKFPPSIKFTDLEATNLSRFYRVIPTVF
jgi:hypothetical protein